MIDRIFRIATRHPKAVFVSVVLLVAVAGIGSQMVRVKVDTDPQNMLPADQAERVFHNETRAQFSAARHDRGRRGQQQRPRRRVQSRVRSRRLHELSKCIQNIEGVIARDVMSPSTVDKVTPEGNGHGALRVVAQRRRPETREQGTPAACRRACALPMLKGSLVTENGQRRGPVRAHREQERELSHQPARSSISVPATKGDEPLFRDRPAGGRRHLWRGDVRSRWRSPRRWRR
jgi:hypothetical protein